MVRATALEQVKRQSRTKSAGAGNESTPTMKKRSSISRLLFFTILLLVLAALLTAGFFAYRAYSEQGIPKEANLPSIIFAEQTVPLSLERTTPAILRASLGNARAALSSAAGSMVRIVPTVSTTTNGKMETRAATGREFLNALGVQVPLELSGSLGEEFFLGLQTGDSNPPVLIFTLTSYERAFAGMLAWEKTLSDSLVPLFTRVPVTVAAPDGSIAGNSFADVVIKNFDVRVLTDPGDANNAILYSFPNRGLLIITVNPYTLTEVLSRLQAARKL